MMQHQHQTVATTVQMAVTDHCTVTPLHYDNVCSGPGPRRWTERHFRMIRTIDGGMGHAAACVLVELEHHRRLV